MKENQRIGRGKKGWKYKKIWKGMNGEWNLSKYTWMTIQILKMKFKWT